MNDFYVNAGNSVITQSLVNLILMRDEDQTYTGYPNQLINELVEALK